MPRRTLCAVAIMASILATSVVPSGAAVEHRHHHYLHTAPSYPNPLAVNEPLVRLERYIGGVLTARANAAEAIKQAQRRVHQHVHVAAVVVAPADLASVMACIKDHESGDYARNNHGPNGASGAYQIVGSTWRSWSARAGYGGFSAAYLAPPPTQDAVVIYMLRNGGAHNWDPKWGNDPCTVNL